MNLSDKSDNLSMLSRFTEEQRAKLDKASFDEIYSQLTHPVKYREEQKRTISQLKWGVLIWLLIDLLIVVFSAYNFWGFRLHNSILVALLTSTTAGIIGLLVIVLYWLYPHNKQ